MLTQEQRVQVIAGTVGVIIVAALLLATVVDAAAQGPRFGRGRGGLVNLPSLTEAQRQQIRTLTEQRREGMAMLQQEVAEARRALAASAETGQVDDSKAANLGTATSNLALARARLQADVFAVLTAEQKAELAKRREQMRAWLEARPGGQGGRAGRGRRSGL